MSTKQLDRLKSQLLTSGIQQTDNALWQVINQLIDILRASNLNIETLQSDIDDVGINQLTGDVAAGPGSGSVVATIQPDAVTTLKILNNAVTYPKIRNTSVGSILLGRGSSGPGTVEEITLGTNLGMSGSILNIIPSGGSTPGLNHNLLSLTHPDTVPASPIYGDLIWAEAQAEITPPNIGAVVGGSVVENYYGIRVAMEYGKPGDNNPSGDGAVPQMRGLMALNFITVPIAITSWSSLVYFPPAIDTHITENFYGLRPAYEKGIPGGNSPPSSGAFPQMMGYDSLAFIVPPDQPTVGSGGQWTRLPKGSEGQALAILNNIPRWVDNLALPGFLTADAVTVTGALTGNNAIINSLKLNNRPELVGEWTDVTYAAGDFTASGGTTPTWTVASGDVICFRYRVTNDVMIVQLFLGSTTVASVAGNVTELRVKIPGGYQALGQPAIVVGAQENGVAVADIYATTEPATDNTLIFIRTYPVGSGRAFNQTANATWIGFTFELRIG